MLWLVYKDFASFNQWRTIWFLNRLFYVKRTLSLSLYIWSWYHPLYLFFWPLFNQAAAERWPAVLFWRFKLSYSLGWGVVEHAVLNWKNMIRTRRLLLQISLSRLDCPFTTAAETDSLNLFYWGKSSRYLHIPKFFATYEEKKLGHLRQTNAAVSLRGCQKILSIVFALQHGSRWTSRGPLLPKKSRAWTLLWTGWSR